MNKLDTVVTDKLLTAISTTQEALDQLDGSLYTNEKEIIKQTLLRLKGSHARLTNELHGSLSGK